MTAKVRVAGSGIVLDAAQGEDLLEVLQANGVPISTSCGGVASCGLCRVRVVSGAEHLTPLRSQEIVHLGNVAKIVGSRLACQSKIAGTGEVVIDVPEVGDVEDRKRRKAARLRATAAKTGNASTNAIANTSASASASGNPNPNANANARVEWRPRKLAND